VFRWIGPSNPKIFSEKRKQQAKEPNLSSSDAPAIAKINQLANFATNRLEINYFF
jgi:hypothetical protein